MHGTKKALISEIFAFLGLQKVAKPSELKNVQKERDTMIPLIEFPDFRREKKGKIHPTFYNLFYFKYTLRGHWFQKFEEKVTWYLEQSIF